MTTAKKNLYQKMNSIMAEIEAIPKLNKNEHGHYNYVSHDQITEALRPLFVKHGVHPVISVESAEFIESGALFMEISCLLVNVDDPNDSMVSRFVHANPQMGGKESGAALSYATKYAYSKLFLISGASEELDAMNTKGKTTGGGRRKKTGVITAKQSGFLWVQVDKHEVPHPEVNLKVKLMGFHKVEDLNPGMFDELLDWVRGGGGFDGEEIIPSTAVEYFGKYCKAMKADCPPRKEVEDWTVTDFAKNWKLVKESAAPVS